MTLGLTPLIVPLVGTQVQIVPDIQLGTLIHLVGLIVMFVGALWKLALWKASLESHMKEQIAGLREELKDGVNEVKLDMQRRIGNGPRSISERLAVLESRREPF